MFESIMTSVYETSDSLVGSVTSFDFLLCSLFSIVLGLAVAFIYMFRHKYSKNFVVTLALLPLIVQMVITLVNGNIGAGIAVMGVFNLVRFRSIPGSAKDIGSVFLAMAVGLATGMGYLGLAVVFTVIVAIANLVFVLSPLGKQTSQSKALTVTIPEDLPFEGVFDEVLEQYTTSYELIEVSTANMGSLYKLNYEIRLKEGSEKQLIDELRCLNGNLKVVLGRSAATRDVL